MKILWITNVLFPEMAREMGESCPISGGWLKASADILLQKYPHLELAVAAPCRSAGKLIHRNIKGITYYCVPTDCSHYDNRLPLLWRHVRDEFQPDVVHLHGTEYAHGLAYIRGCGAEKVVISIQGLVSVIRRYERASIPIAQYCRNASLRYIIKGEFCMSKRAQCEIPILKEGKHFIGRTEWDKTHLWVHNPNAAYYFCNETLRKPFYMVKWNVNTCKRNRIFLSQASDPLKGLHQVIKALPLILRHYPDTKVYIAGCDFLNRKGLKGYLKTSTYANIIRKLIRQEGLEQHLKFLGPLSAEEMVKQFLMANVFICPSSIENSPNSLGEAQLVGTPCVSSYVGGTMDMVEHRKTGMLYRYEEHEMLAKYVCDIFASDDLAMHLSVNERASARIRHDAVKNAELTYEIYKHLIH